MPFPVDYSFFNNWNPSGDHVYQNAIRNEVWRRPQPRKPILPYPAPNGHQRLPHDYDTNYTKRMPLMSLDPFPNSFHPHRYHPYAHPNPVSAPRPWPDELIKRNAAIPSSTTVKPSLTQKLRHRWRNSQAVQDELSYWSEKPSTSGTKPFKLPLDLDISSQKITVKWMNPDGLKDDVHYTVQCSDSDGRSWEFEQQFAQMQREFRVTPGCEYRIEVRCHENSDAEKVLGVGVAVVRSQFSIEEQEALFEKATQYAGLKMHYFEYLYRCKPKSYFDEIHHLRSGLMEVYAKDNNGQPANRINGIISGLFFSARLQPDGSLPFSSPFGNVRMLVEARLFLDPDYFSYYFADFYCNYLTHYVTVVVCKRGSPVDEYCRDNLLSLNPTDNPFLKASFVTNALGQPRQTFLINQRVWVEILYTEHIPLDIGRFTDIQATGAGTSKIGGLSNNKYCSSCNLYPLEETNEEEEEEAGLLDVTVGDALNSTYITIMDQNMQGLAALEDEDYEAVVEVLCQSVDSVCEDAAVKAEEEFLNLEDSIPEGYSGQESGPGTEEDLSTLNAKFLDESHGRILSAISSIESLTNSMADSNKQEVNDFCSDLRVFMNKMNEDIGEIQSMAALVESVASGNIKLDSSILEDLGIDPITFKVRD